MGSDPASAMITGVLMTDSITSLLGEREANLRQVILRAHRAMNLKIAKRFAARGYRDIRPAHLTVLANMDLGETLVSGLSERAQMTPDGVRQLVSELERIGYVITHADAYGKDLAIRFTDAGWELMLTSFNIQKEIEADCRTRLQAGDLEQLRRILGIMAASE